MKKIIVMVFFVFLTASSSVIASAAAAPEPAAGTPLLNQLDAAKVPAKPVVAFLPVINQSGLADKYAKEAIKVINERTAAKFADKWTVLSGPEIEKVTKDASFENYDAPVLAELVNVGKKLGADYVMFISLEPFKGDGGGFHLGVGSSSIKVEIVMKAKFVNVQEAKYVVNKVITGSGSSSAVTIAMFGGASPKNAVIAGTNKCMDTFFQDIP